MKHAAEPSFVGGLAAATVQSLSLSLPRRAYRLIPVVDLDVIGRRPPSSRFHELSEAQHEHRPLHAAMCHELHGLAPVPVTEEHDGEFPVLGQVEGRVCSDPFLRALAEAPVDFPVGFECDDLHGHSAELLALWGLETDVDCSTGLRRARCFLRPPASHTVDRGQRGIDLRGGSLDPHAMNDVRHVILREYSTHWLFNRMVEYHRIGGVCQGLAAWPGS